MKNSKHRERHYGDVIALMAGGITVVLGFLVLLGWILRFSFLTSFGADLVPMAPSTALLFFLFGTLLVSRILRPESRFTYFFGIAVGSIASATAIILFFSSSAGIYSNIEHMGLSIAGSLDGIVIGHMSPATAACFFVCALAFLMTLSPSLERAMRAWTASVLAFLVILTSSLFLIAYLFMSPLMYGGGVIPPSLPTSLAFLILAIGLLVSAGVQVWPYNRIRDEVSTRVSYIFLLIFILLATGIITSGYFAYRNYEKSYRTEIEQQLSAIAESKVDQLVQWRKERMGDGQVFYKNNVFSVVVKRYLQNPNDQEAKTRILAWVGQVQRAYGYDLMLLLDRQFNTRLVFPENREQARLVIDQRNTEILLSGNIAFQDFYRNEKNQHVYLKILVPILDDHSPRRMIACLALRIDPTQYLYPMIEKWPTLSKTSETLIVRRDGNDALFLNELKFQKDAAMNLRVPLERKEVLAVKAALGMEGVVEGIDYRGELVIGNVRTVPDSPWFLVARMDTSEVYAPLRERLWLMIVLVGALLVGAGASVGLMWRHQRNRFYREQYDSAEALRETNEYLENLFNYANAPIIVWNPTLVITRFNHAFEYLSGYSADEVTGKKIDVLFPKGKIDTSLDLINRAVGGERWETVEIEIQRKDGDSRIVLWNSANILDKDGTTVVATIAQGHDITERKRAEEALAIQARTANIFLTFPDYEMFNEVLKIILDVMHSPFGVFGFIDEDGASVVPTMTRQIWDKCQVPEKTIRFPRETWGNSTWPRALSEKRTIFSNEPSTNIPEGHVGIQRHISMPILYHGEAIGLFQVANKETDYTEADIRTLETISGHVAPLLSSRLSRERAEKVLESEQALLTALINSPSDIIIFSLDTHYCYTTFNEKHREEMKRVWNVDIKIGISLLDCMKIPELRAFAKQSIDRALKGEAFSEIQHQPEPDIYYEFSWNPIFQQKDVVGVTVFITDVTARKWAEAEARSLFEASERSRSDLLSILEDQKRAEEEIQKLNAGLETRVAERTAQLETANKELEAFSYSVSHDLRAPLRAIDGFSRIVAEEYAKQLDAEGNRLLNVIRANTQKMDELITDLLSLSRFARSEMQFSRVDMSKLANSIYHEIASPEVRKIFSFSVGPIPDAYCDNSLIRQVWVNLISNAVKFTTPKDVRTILIGSRCEDGMNIYSVKDSGVGFNPEYAHKLFGVFQRLHKAEEFEGTGVGLAIVQRIVHRHGGRVWAEGKVGEGATFYFSIPDRH